MKKLILAGAFLLIGVSLVAQPASKYTTAKALEQVLAYRSDRKFPLILAHRGGPEMTETENSLETFRHTVQQIPDAIIEMDVRMTADSVLVLLHDDEIERTTTGKGLLKGQTWAELKAVFLRDLQGHPTRQRIPLFDDVLRWGAGKVLMAIDAKPEVDLRKVMKAIVDRGALHSVFVICYSTADAVKLRTEYPDVWIALGFNTADHGETLQKAGLSLHHLIALAARQGSDFYRRVHQDGIACTAGTYGPDNLDEKPISEVDDDYRKIFQTGADILTTDRPVAVWRLFKDL
ncbi:glycerophosphodiester phosphodiesterase family protein [Larkinella punicea]|uniref:Glycerophosphodiester phosphodiesterase n=1 Tax=Larkinella punicea TaxID=2315727 RepID=A0A368JS07_9BACT|nr:glycerophosphodiester phosphodiesterase family protein [Larkinella punicea]RCR70418.1 glycerophosphodiester phosphodiesterase [Larkinella punicea]